MTRRPVRSPPAPNDIRSPRYGCDHLTHLPRRQAVEREGIWPNGGGPRPTVMAAGQGSRRVLLGTGLAGMTAAGPAGPAGHVPVLVERVVELMAPALDAPDAVVVDATLGLAGHAAALLEHFPSVQLIGVDRDAEALRRSSERLAPYGARVSVVHAVYDELPAIVAERGLARVDGVLFDLGVSSIQLDEPQRGFSYAHDAPLDMRMNPTDDLTAADVLNTYDVRDLARVLREYGEERFARRIAEHIVRARGRQPLSSTGELVDIVRGAIPAPARRHGGHPAKRTFQALRIEVNAELTVLERALPAAIDTLRIGGRIAVLAYQSLEDRIVKRTVASRARPTTPPDLPVQPPPPQLRLLTRGAEKASAPEVAANPRAASVRLRAAERIAA
jgi:16S rRNA (cytosine1402-N4)-methyltransferase